MAARPSLSTATRRSQRPSSSRGPPSSPVPRSSYSTATLRPREFGPLAPRPIVTASSARARHSPPRLRPACCPSTPPSSIPSSRSSFPTSSPSVKVLQSTWLRSFTGSEPVRSLSSSWAPLLTTIWSACSPRTRPTSVSHPLETQRSRSAHSRSSKTVRQRTIGSPARDYIPILRVAGWVRYSVGKVLGIKDWSFDEKEEKARYYRRRQQVYIQKMLGGLKERIANGDETPSILGNILRQGLLKDEEVLLASYTGSMLSPLPFSISHLRASELLPDKWII